MNKLYENTIHRSFIKFNESDKKQSFTVLWNWIHKLKPSRLEKFGKKRFKKYGKIGLWENELLS